MPRLRDLVIAATDLGASFHYSASGTLSLRLPKDRAPLPQSLLALLRVHKPALTLYLLATRGVLPPAVVPTLPLCEPGTHLPFPATTSWGVVRQCQDCPMVWPGEEDAMHARLAAQEGAGSDMAGPPCFPGTPRGPDAFQASSRAPESQEGI